MAAGSNKEVRVSFIVDDQSVQKAKRAILEVTQAVKTLVEQTQKVNLGFGGGGGGGGGFGGVSAASNQPGISATSQIQNEISGSGAGAMDGITRAATNSSLLFKGAATGSKEAFKSMSDGLKTYVDQADSQILRLQRSLKVLEDGWIKVAKASGAAVGGGGGAGGAGGSSASGSGGGGFPGGSGGGPEDLSTRTSRFGNWMSQPFGGQGARGWLNNSAFGQGANQLAGRIPGYGMMASFGIPGAIAAGVAGPLLMAASAGNSNAMANNDYTINANMFSANAKAKLGDIYGGNAVALHHGNFALSHAIGAITNSKELAGIQSYGMTQALEDKINLKHRVGVMDNLAAGNVGGAISAGVDSFGQNARRAAGRLKLPSWLGGAYDPNDVTGSWSPFTKSSGDTGNIGFAAKQQLEKQTVQAGMITQKPEQIQALIEAKMREDPMYNDRLTEQTGNYAGTLALARASGVSNRIRTLKDGTQIAGTAALDSFGKTAGFGGAEGLLPGMQQMGSIVGRGFMSGGTGANLLNIQAGGLGNAAQLMAMGSQFSGSGGYGSFMKNIQGQIGRGAVDITAASHITGLGASAMSAGSFAGTGEGLMTSMLDAGNTGTIGGDMRMARNMAGGMAAMGAVASGGLDPLQQALNASAAMQAAPGASYGTKQALMKMDPATAMDALRNNRVPPELANLGVTIDMLRKYISTQDATSFARIESSRLAGTAAGAEVERFKKAGGLSYLKGMSRKEQQAAIGRLASGATIAGAATDFGSARARLSMELSSRGFSGARKRGSGSGSAADVSDDTVEGAAAKFHGGEAWDTGKHNAAENKAHIDDVKKAKERKEASEKERKTAQGQVSGGTPEQAIQGVSAALNAFVAALKNINNGPVKVGAPQASGK